MFLAACAQTPPHPAVDRTPRPLSRFELDGRVVVRVDQSRHYANMSWRHEGTEDAIQLNTPLGQGVAALTRGAQGARLTMADGRKFQAADWEELSEQVFGSRLPLNDLAGWISGRPPAAALGWQVEYLEYASDAVDALPTLIEIRRGDIGVRLKVSEWVVAE